MRLQNKSRYPDDEVRALVRFGFRGTWDRGVAVHVRNTNGTTAGQAYDGVPAMSPRARQSSVHRLVTLRIGPPERFPTGWQYPGLKRAPAVILDDWREGLVHLAAHEARHVYQFRTGKRQSEVDAERHAERLLERFRLHAPDVVPGPYPEYGGFHSCIECGERWPCRVRVAA